MKGRTTQLVGAKPAKSPSHRTHVVKGYMLPIKLSKHAGQKKKPK